LFNQEINLRSQHDLAVESAGEKFEREVEAQYEGKVREQEATTSRSEAKLKDQEATLPREFEEESAAGSSDLEAMTSRYELSSNLKAELRDETDDKLSGLRSDHEQLESLVSQHTQEIPTVFCSIASPPH
jgi:hypothetical protein